MIGIGTGAIALGSGGGNWVARDLVARNAHLFFSPATGHYAKNGAPVGFSQMGTFEAAGTRFEQQESGLLVPRGVDVPRLADHSTGERRFLMTGSYTNECSGLAPTNNASVTLLPDEVGPDGQTGSVYRVQLAAAPSSAVAMNQALTADHKFASVFIKEYGVSGSNDVALYGSRAGGNTQGSVETASSDWQRISLDIENNTAAFLNNDDDSFATDVLVALPNVVYGDALLPPLALGATSAPDLFTSDLSGFDLWGGFWVYFEGELNAVVGSNDRVVQIDSGSNTDRCVILYRTATNSLSVQMFDGGVSQTFFESSHTLGSTVRLAARFQDDATSFVLLGTEVGTDTTCTLPTLSEFNVAADAAGGNKPASLTPAKLWIAPASAYTVADMEALTA